MINRQACLECGVWNVVLGLVLISTTHSGWAADETLTDDTVVVKTEEGHQLLLPKDWPVEHKDGRIAPVPMEAYLSLKFGQVKEGFGQVDRRMDALERRVEALEKGQQELLRGLHLLEQRPQPQEGTHGHPSQGP